LAGDLFGEFSKSEGFGDEFIALMLSIQETMYQRGKDQSYMNYEPIKTVKWKGDPTLMVKKVCDRFLNATTMLRGAFAKTTAVPVDDKFVMVRLYDVRDNFKMWNLNIFFDATNKRKKYDVRVVLQKCSAKKSDCVIDDRRTRAFIVEYKKPFKKFLFTWI